MTTNQIARRGQQTAVAQPATGGNIPSWLLEAQQEMEAQGLKKIGDVPDMGGTRIPQISIDGNVFVVRMGRSEEPIHLGDGTGMTFVIVQAAGKYESHRRLYDKAYDPNDPEPGSLVCWSTTGRTPDDTVVTKQSPTCQNCPVFSNCNASWPALVWVIDDNYVGPARWNMNFNTRRNAPVLPTINKQYHAGSWYSVEQFLDMVNRVSAVGTANLLLRAEFDRGKDVVKGKCIVSVVGTTPPDHLDAIDGIDPDLFEAVFRPVITPRVERGPTIEGNAEQTSRGAPRQAPRASAPRAPAPRVAYQQDAIQDAEIVDDHQEAPRQAPVRQAPRQSAPVRQAPRQVGGPPPGTQDDFAQAPSRGAPVRQAPVRQAPARGAPVPGRGAPVFANRNPVRAPAGPLAGRRQVAPPSHTQDNGYEGDMDTAGADEGYEQ